MKNDCGNQGVNYPSPYNVHFSDCGEQDMHHNYAAANAGGFQ